MFELKYLQQKIIPFEWDYNRSNRLSIGKYIKHYFKCRHADILLRQSMMGNLKRLNGTRYWQL